MILGTDNPYFKAAAQAVIKDIEKSIQRLKKRQEKYPGNYISNFEIAQKDIEKIKNLI